MNTTININFKPNESEFKQISEWLYSEYKKYNTGFYCNIGIIKQHFDENRMAIMSVNKKVIGFITWAFYTEFSAVIVIAEVHSDFRKYGYGKIIANQLLMYLKNAGIMTVDLECSPTNSIHFWKKNKFRKFPENFKIKKDNVELFRMLVDSQKPKSIKDTEINAEVIELWSSEPWETTDSNPDWQWQLKFRSKSKQLVKPIIFPCKFDWRIRWRKGDEVIFDDKVKRFNKIKVKYGSYLIIENL